MGFYSDREGLAVRISKQIWPFVFKTHQNDFSFKITKNPSSPILWKVMYVFSGVFSRFGIFSSQKLWLFSLSRRWIEKFVWAFLPLQVVVPERGAWPSKRRPRPARRRQPGRQLPPRTTTICLRLIRTPRRPSDRGSNHSVPIWHHSLLDSSCYTVSIGSEGIFWNNITFVTNHIRVYR